MGTLLQVVGVLFLVFILLMVLAFVWVRSNLRALGKALQAAATPARIHLVRELRLDWQNATAVDGLVVPLRACGFEDVGWFSIPEMPTVKLLALVNVRDSAYAVVYEHPQAGVWLDLVSRYQPGGAVTGVTFTSATYPGAGQLDKPPGKVSVYAPGLNAASLLRRFLAERLLGDFESVSAELFPTAFETAYAEEMDWRNSRGGPTEAEIRRVAAASGQAPSDEVVTLTQEQMSLQAAALLEDTLRDRFLAQTQMSAAEWERVRERILIVHDRLTPAQLVERLDLCGGDTQGVEALPAGVASLRAVFAELNNARPEARRFAIVGEVAEPVLADFYCAPEGCAPDRG